MKDLWEVNSMLMSMKGNYILGTSNGIFEIKPSKLLLVQSMTLVQEVQNVIELSRNHYLFSSSSQTCYFTSDL